MNLIIDHLSKSFGEKKVLEDIHFSFEEGKIYGLLGRNGAGKTTLFNCLNGDMRMEQGRFFWMSQGAEREIAPEEIGYVLSVPTVPEFLTGREFLKFFIEIHEGSTPAPQTIDGYFDLLNIVPEDRDRLLKDYSHGMKNKMQMLVHLVAQPKLLLLDEPLTSLDVVAAEEMKVLLRDLKPGRITILSTHIMELALDLCDEIVLLSQGRLQVLPKEELNRQEFKDRIVEALREDGNA
ncbi:MAG: ABC transporter ATP-binding protein [Ndongobacter sp.]|nr:ABC transporter ATP-binding protein [Ndongobacter sp.]